MDFIIIIFYSRITLKLTNQKLRALPRVSPDWETRATASRTLCALREVVSTTTVRQIFSMTFVPDVARTRIRPDVLSNREDPRYIFFMCNHSRVMIFFNVLNFILFEGSIRATRGIGE